MRALWSDRQTCSHNVSQKLKRIRRSSDQLAYQNRVICNLNLCSNRRSNRTKSSRPIGAFRGTAISGNGKVRSSCRFSCALSVGVWGHCSQVPVSISIWGTYTKGCDNDTSRTAFPSIQVSPNPFKTRETEKMTNRPCLTPLQGSPRT